jgi:endonuclease-3
MAIDLSQISKLSTSGIYTLILFMSKEFTVTIGSLGKQSFHRGYYSYTGSALGKGSSNLKNRISRHLRKEKRQFWHIDYLLSDENVSVEAVIAVKTSKNVECSLNSYLKSISGAEITINRFGASDCKKNCKSHLLFFPGIENPDCLIQKLVEYISLSAGIPVSVIH